MREPPWTRYRVFLLENIVTREGDLIVAGTGGCILHWDEDVALDKDTDPMVMVQWDHYLWFDTDTEHISYDHPPNKKGDAYTGCHYNWSVPISKIRVRVT